MVDVDCQTKLIEKLFDENTKKNIINSIYRLIHV